MRFERFAIAAWTVLLMSASLTVVVPNLHWYATAALVPVIIYNSLRATTNFLEVPLILPITAFLLILSMVFISLDSAEVTRDLGQCVKTAFILLLILPLVVSNSARRNALWEGVEAAVYTNVLLIIGGLTINPQLFGVQGFARFGTYAAPPGGLWQVGAIGLTAAELLPASKSKLTSLRRTICALASIVFIMLDGSRTGLLVIGLAFVIYAPRVIRSLLRRPVRALIISLSLVTLTACATPLIDDFFGNFGVFFRLQHALGESGNGTGTADALDSTRTAMYRTVVNAIGDHPIVGSGLNTTLVETEYGTEVVHCSFLQVWADVGLLGFLAYSTLTLAPLLAALRHKLISGNQRRTRDALPAIFLACSWVCMGCFHPVSTELTEWIWFFLLIAALGNCGVYESRCMASLPITHVRRAGSSTFVLR